MSDRTDFHETFCEIELDTGLFDIEVDGVPVWERIRFSVYRDVQSEVLDFGEAHDSIDFDATDYARGLYLWLRNSIRRNPYFAGEHDVLVWGHPRRKIEDDGLWWDIYCDPLYETLDLDSVHVEPAYQNRHRTPARTESLRYLDLIEYTGTLLRKSGLVSVTVPKAVERQLNTADGEFEARLDVRLELADLVEYTLAVRQSTKRLYERLLGRVDPEIVVVVVSYGKETFIEVCKERDVPVVELQHGVIHSNHVGYAYPSERTKYTFPDYLFTFGEFWNDAAAYPIPDERVVSVGYPYLDRQVEQYIRTESNDQLIFISQGPIGKELSRFAVELANSDEVHHNIVYKLHPGEYDRWKEAYPWLKEGDITVVDSESPSLYQLFGESTAQVGVGSTAVYEGLCFDLETFVYDIGGSTVLKPLVEEGAANLVSTVPELACQLGTTDQTFDRDRYFSSNPIENLNERLQAIETNNRGATNDGSTL